MSAADWCKFFSGFDRAAKTRCDMNITLRDVSPGLDWTAPGVLDKLPCGGDAAARPLCGFYIRRDPADVEEARASMRRALTSVSIVLLRIDAHCRNMPKYTPAQGQFTCPRCGDGVVHWSRASNGHRHARCTSPNCVSFME